MEVILNIKNVSKAFDPKDGDVIIFNGKNWYITTKEDLLQDAYKLINETREDNAAFKKEIAEQMVEFSVLIKKLYENK